MGKARKMKIMVGSEEERRKVAEDEEEEEDVEEKGSQSKVKEKKA